MASTDKDLIMPSDPDELEKLIGDQGNNNILRIIGVGILSMVAIHYGGYALKNAGANLLTRHLSNITINSRRTTTIAEDIFGIGKKLDNYSKLNISKAEDLGRITDHTQLGKEFAYRAKARAAQQIKRLPFEFLPAWAVEETMRPQTEAEKSSTYHLKTIGRTLLFYGAADIAISPALKTLGRTQTGQLAQSTLKNFSPGALDFVSQQLNKAAIKGYGGAKALGAMYRTWESMPQSTRIPTPSNVKQLWKDQGKPGYRAGSSAISSGASEGSIPWFMKLMRQQSVEAHSLGFKSKQFSYMDDWTEALQEETARSGHRISKAQALDVLHSLQIGHDLRKPFAVQFDPANISGNNQRWYSRFGHSESTIEINKKVLRDTINKKIPQLRSVDDGALDRILQTVTEQTDNIDHRAWTSAGLPGRRPPASYVADSVDLPGGYLQEKMLRQYYAFNRRQISASERNRLNRLGVRHLTWGEYGARLRSSADTGETTQLFREWEKVNRAVAASTHGGVDSRFYKSWQDLPIDRGMYVRQGYKAGDNVIDFTTPRGAFFDVLNKLEGTTRIPILGFNPMQLAQWRERRKTPEVRWLGPGSYHPGLGRVITTPHVQFGDRILGWQGVRNEEIVAGRFKTLPGRWKAYTTSPQTTTGRLVRNVLGVGDDQVRTGEGVGKKRLIYKVAPRLAHALDISEFTSGSIGNAIKDWAKATPMYAVARKTATRFPQISRWAYNKVPDTFWPKELDRIMAFPGSATPEEVSRVLNQVTSVLHPNIPRDALEDIGQWLPGVYNSTAFKKVVSAQNTVSDVPNLTTSALIGDVMQGRRQLFDVIKILEDDAVAQSKLGGSTYTLFKTTLSTVKKDIVDFTKSGTPGALPLDARQFGRGYYNIEDKARRSIVSYLLARPTTVSITSGARNQQLSRVMQISELDNLVSRISSVRGYGSVISGELRGAVASLKLMSYRANFANDTTAMAQAIAGDRALISEISTNIKSWSRFPGGRGWRSQGPDALNQRIALNKFADQYTYMEKFGSAWNRAPEQAARGIALGGGSKTGLSMGAYHIANRLRAALRLVGLDFSEGKYTNLSDLLVGGFLFRRILPGMAAVEIYRYADWKTREHTGAGISERSFDYGVVRPSITAAGVMDSLGIRESMQWFGKITGEEDRMNALKYLTKTGTEMSEFWESGEVPIRRGRWWMLGSTQFEGGRTIAYVPNFYKRLQSRYQYTWEGGRGPEDFYFSHSWLPNLSNPLAPLNRITDPYAFEKATYHSRPYPITGDFFTGPYGPLNPILNSTLGQLIKPTKQMHPGSEAYTSSGITQYGAPLEGVDWGMPLVGAKMAHAQLASANSKMVGQAMTGASTAGMQYGIGYEATSLLNYQVGVPMEVVEAATPRGIWTTPVSVGSMKETAYRFQEMAGIYGFGVQSVRTSLGLAGEYAAPSYIPSASEAYGFQNRFWNMQMGGLGDVVIPGISNELSNITFSEIFRRFVPRQPTSVKVNPIANSVWMENPWLPGPYSGYFQDYSVGDIYNKTYGSLILPGEAYDRAYGNEPDYERGMYHYGPIDRLRILSKNAPWSREYRAYNKSISHMALTPEQRAEYETIRSQVEDINTKYRFAPYRFKGIDFENRNYEVMGITDEGYLNIRGLGTPVKLAGLEPGGDLANALREQISIGQRYDMQIDVNRPKFTYENDQRMLEAVVGNINEKLIGSGLPQEIGGSPLSYYARTNPLERLVGSAWESATHSWNPLTTKFIQRRTALEEYERTQVYGVDYAPWTQPYESFIRPQFDSVGAKSFLGSVATGAVIGGLAAKGAAAKSVLSTLIGSALGANKIRVEAYEAITGNAWIPSHVKERWAQEEYMDTLQYVAAAKNYSLLRSRALAAGEQDPETLWQREQSVKSWLSERKRNVTASIIERSVFGGVSKKEYFAENPIAEQAYSLREAMGRTLYGANLSGDYLSLQSAIPKERRMYFEQFLNAPVEERERILSLLPRAERRIYESAWGMQVEERPRLSDYFEDNYLPGPEAAIWSTSVDWDKVRIRMIQKSGGDPSKYGYYPQEVTESNMYPIPVPRPDMSQIQNIKNMLERILGKSQINGLSINVEPSSTAGFSLDMNVTRDMYSHYDQMVGKGMGEF